MKWEYLIELTSEVRKDRCNALGSQGWELVTVIASNGYERELYWKRRVEDGTPVPLKGPPRPKLTKSQIDKLPRTYTA